MKSGRSRIACLLIRLALLASVALVAPSCGGIDQGEDESEPDIRLGGAHCIISEPDQEPIVIDALSFEMLSDSDTVVMRDAEFFQLRRGSDRPGISGRAGYLSLDSQSQDVRLSGGVEIIIYPDDEAVQPAAGELGAHETGGEIMGSIGEAGDSAYEMDGVDEPEDADGMDSPAQSVGEADGNGEAEMAEDAQENAQETEQESVGQEAAQGRKLNRIRADEMAWSKYSQTLESPRQVSLEWEGIVVRATGFRGDLNTGEFFFDSVEEGSL